MNKQELKQQIELYDDLLDSKDYLRMMGYYDGPERSRDFKICCPIHEETEPSFSYSESMGIWTCFGACHTSGRVVKLHYMLLKKQYGEKLSIVNALNDLHTLFPHILPKLQEQTKIKEKTDIQDAFLSAVKNNLLKPNQKPKIMNKDIDINDYLLIEFLRGYNDKMKSEDWR